MKEYTYSNIISDKEYKQEKEWIAHDLGNCQLQRDQEKIVELWFRAIRLELAHQGITCR